MIGEQTDRTARVGCAGLKYCPAPLAAGQLWQDTGPEQNAVDPVRRVPLAHPPQRAQSACGAVGLNQRNRFISCFRLGDFRPGAARRRRVLWPALSVLPT